MTKHTLVQRSSQYADAPTPRCSAHLHVPAPTPNSGESAAAGSGHAGGSLSLALALAIFSGITSILTSLSGLSSYDGARVSEEDLGALAALQSGFSKCVDGNGLRLQSVSGEDYCRVIILYRSDTVSK